MKLAAVACGEATLALLAYGICTRDCSDMHGSSNASSVNAALCANARIRPHATLRLRTYYCTVNHLVVLSWRWFANMSTLPKSGSLLDGALLRMPCLLPPSSMTAS